MVYVKYVCVGLLPSKGIVKLFSDILMVACISMFHKRVASDRGEEQERRVGEFTNAMDETCSCRSPVPLKRHLYCMILENPAPWTIKDAAQTGGKKVKILHFLSKLEGDNPY